MKKSLLLVPLLCCFINKISSQVAWPGGRLPVDTPQIFAAGIVSDGLSNRDFTISPKGDEIFFTIQQPNFASSTIVRLIKANGKWSVPETASFSGVYRDLEAAFSPDGQTIYFSSDRPLHGDSLNSFDIWKVKKSVTGNWEQPENLGPVVNTVGNEFYPSVTKTGNLYFTANAADGKGSEDIVVCKWTGTGYAKPESLPADINTAHAEFNAFVDPDEQYIIFSSFGRTGDSGGGDLYISHRDANNQWTAVKNLPKPLNSAGLDYCPFVSWDKQSLFFTSNRANAAFGDGKHKNYKMLKTLLLAPGNGNDDIYWIKFNQAWLQ